MNIKANIQQIQTKIKAINPRAKLVVATKNHAAVHINQAIRAGAKIIGENRWQEAKRKLPYLLDCEKHFIGHLQTNKVKYIVKNFDCIQSVDSLKLALKIDQEAQDLSKIMPIMIQVNISYDQNKYGVIPQRLANLLASVKDFKNVKLIGLMAITAIESDQKKRQDFKQMKRLFDQYQSKYHLTELSLGMSSDYEIALRQGATMVRIGRAIFS